MPLLEVPDELQRFWGSVKESLKGLDAPTTSDIPWLNPPFQGLLSGMMPDTPQSGYESGLLSMTPAFTLPEYRAMMRTGLINTGKILPTPELSTTASELASKLEEGLQRLPESWYKPLNISYSHRGTGLYSPYDKEVTLGFGDFYDRFRKTGEASQGQFITGHEVAHGALDELSKKLNMKPDEIAQELINPIDLAELGRILKEKAGPNIRAFNQPTRPRETYWGPGRMDELGADLIGLHTAGIDTELDFFKQLKELYP